MHPSPRSFAARAVPPAAAAVLLALAVCATGAPAAPGAAPPPPLPLKPAPIVGAAWGAPEGLDPCASQDLLERCLAADPALRERREMFDRMVREAERTGLIPGRVERLRATSVGAPTYVIPVAVHIVHQNGPERLSNNQVKSQIDALNRDMRNAPGNGVPAVDTKIEFCLATNLPAGSTVVWDSLPGITRANSPETNHIYGNVTSETNLKAIDYLPSDRYLNIWVVKTISGGSGGVAGYATYPGAVPPTLDGIVMRYDVFGSNYIPAYGSAFTLLPSNDNGKILTHEVGHYLNLYHPFQGGCTPPGDQVADTPPEQVNHAGCPAAPVTSCTAAPDPIENFMDYTNDACRFAFTAGQLTRMTAAIATYRAKLVSGQNLIDAGCSSGLNALITASPAQLCAGGTVQFSTPASGAGYTYAWSFPGGSPASAATQSPTVTYATPGTYGATLTVTDASSNFSTNTTLVYVKACAPILSHCTNWVFSSKAAVSFATGTPVAFAGTQNTMPEPAATMSDAAGNLAFYTDGASVFDATNAVMPNGAGILAGGSSHSGVLAIPRPGSATQYFLFTVRQYEDGLTANPLNYSVVDMTLNAGKGNVVPGSKNIPVALPGAPDQLLEGLALIPHCNGTDWWLITHGAGPTNGNKVFVTLVTAAGPGASVAYPIGMNLTYNSPGMITASVDGTRFAAIAYFQDIAAWDFDRATGVPTVAMAPITTLNPWADVALSPDNQLLYFNYATSSFTVFGVKQLQIATGLTRDVVSGMCGMRLGPDGLLYLGPAFGTSLHCVNQPNNFNVLNLNECALSLNSVPLAAGTTLGQYGTLPNMTPTCVQGAQPAAFTYTVTGCTNVSFHALNCAGPYSWSASDGFVGSGQNVSHIFAAPGVYSVTLTVPGASPTSVTLPLTLQTAAVSIAGSAYACVNPSNYSAVGPANYSYVWNTTGGTPATGTGNNIDVTWPATGGTIALGWTDPVTGCTGHTTLTVGKCPVCVPPPLNMSAWWPLDEPIGTLAQETVAGAAGADIGTPPHSPGKVRRARSFNGTNQYEQVNDAASVNFGTGDLTIDAWIRTSSSADPLSIVDKRTLDPDQGYWLYLKAGRLALRLADGTSPSGTDFWSNTTPYVADGLWHHVAAVARRGTGGGTRLFVDGNQVASFAPFTATGSVTNPEKLLIGAQEPSTGPLSYFAGDIDEVEIFKRGLTNVEVQGIALADTMGKCKEFAYLPSNATLCRNQAFTTLYLTICNYSTAAQTYNVSFTGLPTGPGCTYAGPSTFQVLTSTPVSVPANTCVPVQFKVFKPVGMPLYATSCYQATVTNTVSGNQVVAVGTLYAARVLCPSGIGIGIDPANTGTPSTLRFTVTNTDDSPVSVPYTITAVPTDGGGTPSAVSLNGLPAGDHVSGVIVSMPPGGSAQIPVDVRFTAPRSFRFYDIVLAFDTDGDGVPDERASTGLTYVETQAPGAVDVSPPAPAPLALRLLPVVPNPLQRFATVEFELPERAHVRIALYDMAGRLVRTLADGTRDAGRGSVTLDARGLSGSVYFVKLQVGRTITSRSVVLVK